MKPISKEDVKVIEKFRDFCLDKQIEVSVYFDGTYGVEAVGE